MPRLVIPSVSNANSQTSAKNTHTHTKKHTSQNHTFTHFHPKPTQTHFQNLNSTKGSPSQSQAMKLTLKESSLIKPSKPTPSHHLWNSNLDLVVGRIHILTVYFYRPNGSSNFFDTHVLKHALGEVLVPFFPMAGRLGKDGDGRVEIVCNGEGVLFVDAESDCCVDDFGEITPSLELRKLAPTVDYDGDVGSYPLFITQVTRFKCGGVALGCGVHHTLSDGLSSLHFINTWSDIARGLSVAIPPFIDRTLLQARDPPTPMFDHVEYHPPPSLIITQSQNSISPSQSKSTSTIMLRLTLDQINKLKSKAKGDGTMHYSTYEILAAHLWRCASKARGLAHDQPTKLYVATDGRSRLNPPLPPGYLGNVVFTATPMAKSGEFEIESLSNTARRIHNELGKMDDKYLRSAIDYLELQSDLSALVRGPSYFASPNLNVNSWTRLPIYESDFGWGRPIFMGPASILYEGTIYIIPHPSGDRSVSLAVCLDPNHMDLFREFLYDF